MCAAVAPDVYVLDDEGYNHMGTFTVRAGFEDQARQGALACPEFAIEVQE
jgi:ferredoxin